MSRLSGELDSLGFTSFRLGGHSVLFPEEYVVGTSLEEESVTGLDAGVGLEYALSSRLALLAGARWTGGSDAELTVRVREILNAEELITPLPLEEIEARLAPGAIRVDPSRLILFAGFKVRLH